MYSAFYHKDKAPASKLDSAAEYKLISLLTILCKLDNIDWNLLTRPWN